MPGAPRILLQMNSIFRVCFAWYLVAAVVAGLLLYLVAPIPSPFLFAGILAYICLPMVVRLAKRLPRWLAVSIVLALPATAALLVDLRHLRAQYQASDLFES